jgi:integrase
MANLLSNANKLEQAAALEARIAAFVNNGGTIKRRGVVEAVEDDSVSAKVAHEPKKLTWDEALAALDALGRNWQAEREASVLAEA